MILGARISWPNTVKNLFPPAVFPQAEEQRFRGSHDIRAKKKLKK
jgi:hypothetical protein